MNRQSGSRVDVQISHNSATVARNKCLSFEKTEQLTSNSKMELGLVNWVRLVFMNFRHREVK